MGNEIDRFVDEVRAFRAFYAHAETMPFEERLATGRDRVLALYATGLALPADCECGDAEAPDVTIARPLDFDRFDYYAVAHRPYSEESIGAPTVMGLLSDDFLDICRDVSRGLALWDANHRTEAIWEWRFHRDTHWGDHATSALRALHCALFELRGHP